MQVLHSAGTKAVRACSGPLQFEALLASGLRWDRSRRCAVLGADSMVTLSAAASPFCRIAPEGAFCSPEEDPFLLLESSLKAIERILQLRRGLPLRRTWIEQPYGEEEITLLEEEVIPAIQQCLSRVDELDARLLAQQELLHRCQLEADHEALGELRLQRA
jgi:hypothetical protein